LKQGLNDPYTVEDQVDYLCWFKKSLRNVPVNKVKEFEKDFLEFQQQTQSNSRCFEQES
jgi:F-type H+-transporting ATPase subunit alpha